jgi:hypothetical protein
MNNTNTNIKTVPLRFPSIEVSCECGHKWYIAIPSWDADWSTWENIKYGNCNKSPKAFKWGGFQIPHLNTCKFNICVV